MKMTRNAAQCFRMRRAYMDRARAFKTRRGSKFTALDAIFMKEILRMARDANRLGRRYMNPGVNPFAPVVRKER